MTTTNATALRNPYREAFDKYVMHTGGKSWREWEARTDWTYTDGFKGAAWDRSMDDVANTYMARRVLSERFAWAVPTDEAILAIAELGPIVEIGAGTGYWAWLLEQAGAEVLAFDAELGGNHWVAEGGPVDRGLTRRPPRSASDVPLDGRASDAAALLAAL